MEENKEDVGLMEAACRKNFRIVIKGAGEMATGIAHRLFMANFKNIIMTEIPKPICVRRTVAFSEAVYKKKTEVEEVTAEYAENLREVFDIWQKEHIAVMVDSKWGVVGELKPDAVVDAIMAKKNIGTRNDEAPIVIGVGPGFRAPSDVHAAIESNRGHHLGKTIYNGSTEAHTGIPGPTMGYTKERVLRAPHSGTIKHVRDIGSEVKKGDLILYVGKTLVFASIDGILRGLIREIDVAANEKIADIDPRGNKKYCYTITEKARAIGGGVLEALLHFYGAV